LQNEKKMANKKIIISGGGTGGHIFPAIAIANAVKDILSDVEILFVGANGRMEMKRVPEAGFQIEGLDIYGLQRKFNVKNIIENLKLPFRLYRSMRQAKKIIKKFCPDVVVGVGGYASGPTLNIAASMKIPTLIQEQNYYPGITNKLLAKKVNIICTSYDNLDRFFPAHKIIKTGNPIRKDILNPIDKREAYNYFQLDENRKTVAVVGGSLGSRTINESISGFVKKLSDKKIQLIWQTGEYYYQKFSQEYKSLEGIQIMPFIQRMDYLYSVADVVVSRAGALALSELCVVGKPCILIPSPNVSEDHQTKNAKGLSDADAAILIPDNKANNELKNAVLELINDDFRCMSMQKNLKKMAQLDAAKQIAEEIVKLTLTSQQPIFY
jgi:UDP-N-acetylglucosamine--N-acetylmuramyl-(pentapeptide) pyrophosphoryl-undecaprenol N-acetylglucosamine transferase